jgi:hypothetical protein
MYVRVCVFVYVRSCMCVHVCELVGDRPLIKIFLGFRAFYSVDVIELHSDTGMVECLFYRIVNASMSSK